MTKPITPEQVGDAKANTIPEFVVIAVNYLIAKHWDGDEAVIRQDEIVDRLTGYFQCARDEVFNNKWLDFEPLFESVGWKVIYDKPDYNESGAAFFTFRKRAV